MNGNWKKSEVKILKLCILTILTTGLMSSSVYAQGSIFGIVANSDLTTPANNDITFVGFLDNADDEIRIESSVGAGYDNGNWFDDFQNYLTEAPGNPYDYLFYNTANSQGFRLEKTIPNNSFQQENILLGVVNWPVIPSGLNAVTISSSAVALNWSASPNLTYHIYRRVATSNGSYFRLDNLAGLLTDRGVADSFFVDATVDGITSYTYVIIAEDNLGNLSAHSNLVTANSAIISPPILISISPNSGPETGATLVNLFGSGFDPAGVNVNLGATVIPATVLSPLHMTIVTPPTIPGAVNVSAVNTASSLSTNTVIGGFTFVAQATPILAAIGPQTVAESALLSFTTSAVDPDGNFPAMTSSTLPGTATYVDNLNGTGIFNWTPTFFDQGIYTVTFYAIDSVIPALIDSEVVTITVTDAGNQAPILATIGAQSTTENINLNFVVSSTDIESIPVVTTSALPGTATFTPSAGGGTFDWTPGFLESGSYIVTFYATDDSAAVDSEVVTITVNEAGNQLPILATIGAQTTAEGFNLNFVVSSSDIESVPIVTTSALPGSSTFTPSAGGGTFDWTPTPLESGIYSVTFYATDDSAAVDSEVVTITVTEGGNQLPILAAIGAQTVSESINLNFVVSSSDAESTPIVTTSTLPGSATFTPSLGGGTFDWTPGFLESGIYSVTFYATDDSAAVDSEVVSITVIDAGNQLPILAAIGAQIVSESINLNFIVSSTDIESTPIVTTSALPGTATFTPSAGGGTFDWAPGFLESGIYSVTFYATDDSAAVDSEVVSITVNEAGNQLPILATIGAQTIPETVNLNFIVISSDIESIPIVTTSVLPGSATFTPSVGGGTFDWTPTALESGIYNVTFYATDDSAAVDSEIVTITVTEGGNAPPILAAIGPRSTTENINLNFVVSSSDIESVPIVTTSALPGTATFTPLAGGGTFNWTPGFLESGIYNVTFYATDDSAAVDSEVVTITVNEAGNQLPVLAVIGAQSTTENINLNFIVSSTDIESVPIVTTSALPGTATFTPSAGGGTFDWTPSFLESGIYSVTFYATDDSAAVDSEVVTITVIEGGNQLPILAAIGAQTIPETANLNFIVASSDIESIPLVTTSALPGNATFSPSAGGGTFDWTPGSLESGIYSVTFYATDDSAAVDSEVVTITVTEGGNFPPILAAIGAQNVSEGSVLAFLINASDGESIPVLTTSALPGTATFIDSGNGVGAFNWATTFSDMGLYSVTFYATDDSLAVDSEVVSISVNDIGNQTPVLTLVGPQIITEGVNLLFNISGTDIESVPALSMISAPAGATFIDSGNGVGTFSWTPDFLQTGSYNVTFFAVDDSSAIDSGIVNIIVLEGGNQAPILDSIGTIVVIESTPLAFQVTASDVESVPALSVGVLPLGATFVDSANGLGVFAWTPDFTQAGTYSVTFYATDDSLAVDSEVVGIIVADAGGQRPVIAPISDTTIAEGASVTLLLSATDADDSLPPNLTFTTTIANALFVDSGNGKATFTYSSTFIDAGIDTVTFFATDRSVPPLTATEIVQIITLDINLAPKLDSLGPFSVLVGDQLQFSITAIDSTDPDTSHIVALSMLNAPVNATFIDSGNDTGLFTFIPDLTQIGIDTVSFSAVDQGVPPLSSIVDVIFTVVADNQGPVIDTISPKSVGEGGTLSFLVSASDPDGDPLTLSVRDQPNNALFVDSGNGVGLFTFTPDFLQGGGVGASELYGVTFVAFDGIDDARELVYIQVFDAGNQNPEFDPITPPSVIEGDSLRFAFTASDPDGNIPTLTADSLPPGATFVDSGNGIGVVSFDPTFVQAGIYVVFITASDGVLTTQIQFTITVIEAGNQTPVLAFDSLVLDFTETQLIDFKFSALDPDLNQPVYTATGVPPGATFTDEGDSAHFVWPTLNGNNGIYNMVVFAIDSLDALIFDSALITINLRDSNFVPFIRISPSGQTRNVNEGGTLTYRVFADDNDGTIPLLQTDTLHPNMNFVDSGNGAGLLTFTPDFTQGSPNPGTPYFVIFRAVDTAGGANLVHQTAPQSFFVLHVDLPPVIAPITTPVSVIEGQTLNFIVSSIDPDGNTPLMRAENVPTNASAVNFGGASNMSFIFAPDFTQAGTYFITFIAAFGGLEDSAIAEVVVVEAGNQSPLWITTLADTISAVAGTPISIPMSAIDVDLDLMVIAASFLPVGAILVDSGNGAATFDYNPDLADVGSNFAIDFIVSDPLLASDTISAVFKVMAFLRGDANSDTQVDLTDVIFIVDFVFRGGMNPISTDAADADASGGVEVSDVSYLVNYLFRRGPAPPN